MPQPETVLIWKFHRTFLRIWSHSLKISSIWKTSCFLQCHAHLKKLFWKHHTCSCPLYLTLDIKNEIGWCLLFLPFPLSRHHFLSFLLINVVLFMGKNVEKSGGSLRALYFLGVLFSRKSDVILYIKSYLYFDVFLFSIFFIFVIFFSILFKRLCHGHNLCTYVRKHFHGSIWRTTHLPLL